LSKKENFTREVEYLKILAEPEALLNLNQKLIVKDCEAKGYVRGAVENAGSSIY